MSAQGCTKTMSFTSLASVQPTAIAVRDSDKNEQRKRQTFIANGEEIERSTIQQSPPDKEVVETIAIVFEVSRYQAY